MTAPRSGSPPLVRLLLLALLPASAMLIYQRGQEYDPRLLTLTPQGAASATTLPSRLGTLLRLEGGREYDRANLYEYINGHAEFFLDAGFERLTVSEYAPANSTTPTLVVDSYTLGDPLQAFGVLMDETPPGATPLTGVELGFVAPREAALSVGNHYLKLTTFDPATPLESLARQLATTLQSTAGTTPLVFDFPQLGTATTTRFIKEGYRGINFLRNVVERGFQTETGQITAFSLLEPSATAEETVRQLTAFLDRERIPWQAVERLGTTVYTVTDPYEGEWFFLRHAKGVLGIFNPFTATPTQPIMEFLVRASR